MFKIRVGCRLTDGCVACDLKCQTALALVDPSGVGVPLRTRRPDKVKTTRRTGLWVEDEIAGVKRDEPLRHGEGSRLGIILIPLRVELDRRHLYPFDKANIT